MYTGVAVNAPQYDGSAPCGMCIAFQGTGPGDVYFVCSVNMLNSHLFLQLSSYAYVA